MSSENSDQTVQQGLAQETGCIQILGERHIVVHGFDTRMHCVYDIDGHPSQISIGALLENITIAASEHGLAASVTRRLDSPEESPVFDVTFHPELDLTPDPLIPYVRTRSVQRRPLSTRALTLDEKLALEKAVGESHHVLWLEGGGNRWRVAKLLFDNAKIRLTMPEAYLVHRDVIAWRARYSDDKVPDQAIGTDPLTTRLMQWVMGSWGRVEFFNTFLAGTWIPTKMRPKSAPWLR